MQINQLKTIDEGRSINELTQEQIKELQTALNSLGYPAGEVDGLVGPKTRNAWAEFKSDFAPGNPKVVDAASIATLSEELTKIHTTSTGDFSTKEGTIEVIKQECIKQAIGLPSQIAYVLATTQWETAGTFKPVKEAYWKSEEWRKNNLRYYPYYGRGYVQLTWQNNYQKYSQLLGVDLVNNPDLALRSDIAVFVLVHGFKTGAFTGRKITDYITQHNVDFMNARRCINGMDHAHDIARLAEKYLQSLS